MVELTKWEKAAEGLIQAIRAAVDLREWRVGKTLRHAERPGFDDRHWPLHKGSLTWCAAEGPRALRKRLVIPAIIEGIPARGSRVGMTFLNTAATEIYLDGRRIYAHRFWADQRATSVPLIARADPRVTHVLTLKCPSGMAGFAASLSIPAVDEGLFELNCMREQLRLARYLVKSHPSARLREALLAAGRILSVKNLAARDWPGIRAEIRSAEAALAPFRAPARKLQLYLVGHAHLDMNWLWTYADTVATAIRDARTVTALMREYADLTYSQNQTHILRILETKRPALFREIRRRVREGRYEVLANTWVEGDLNMAEGESLVRHLLLARDYTQRKLGVVSDVLWEPDTFGHPATLPTLMADAGIRSYFFSRCGNRYPVFRWRAPDGAEVTAFDSWPSYCAEIKPEIMVPRLISYHERSKLARMLFVHGLGDHGGGPTREDIERKRAMENKPVMPTMRFSTARNFFNSIHGARVPIVRGELNPTFEGCYTTHGDIKKANRECQRALLTLETLDAVAGLHRRGGPRADTGDLWRDTLFNQFHDIFDGCAIRSSYDYSLALARRVRRRAASLTERKMKALTTRRAPRAVAVFNPLGWTRDAPVECRAPRDVKDGCWTLRDEAGQAIPAECRQGRLQFTATQLPAFGLRGYRVAERAPRPRAAVAYRPSAYPEPQGWTFETPLYSMVIDPRGGLIKKLRDKACGRDVIASFDPWWDPAVWGAETCGNRLDVYWETPHQMSAWLMGTVYRVDTLLDAQTVRWKAEAFRTVISIRQTYRRSRLQRRIILYPHLPFVDFEVDVDWRENGGPREGVPVLRAGFYLALKNPKAFFEAPFGTVERPTARHEYPALKWAAFNEGDYWVALLNREKHGYNVDGNNLALTLLRNAYDPDPRSDTGRHMISYRLLFGKLDPLTIARSAAEYEMAPVVQPGRRTPGDNGPSCQVHGDVLVTSLKPTMKGNGLAVRFVEVKGRAQDVRIRFRRPPAQAFLSNVLENENRRLPLRRDGTVRVKVRPHALTTLIFRF